MSSGTVSSSRSQSRATAVGFDVGTPGSRSEMRAREASDSPATVTISWPVARRAAARTAPTRPAPTTPTRNPVSRECSVIVDPSVPVPPTLASADGASRVGYRTSDADAVERTPHVAAPERTERVGWVTPPAAVRRGSSAGGQPPAGTPQHLAQQLSAGEGVHRRALRLWWLGRLGRHWRDVFETSLVEHLRQPSRGLGADGLRRAGVLGEVGRVDDQVAEVADHPRTRTSHGRDPLLAVLVRLLSRPPWGADRVGGKVVEPAELATGGAVDTQHPGRMVAAELGVGPIEVPQHLRLGIGQRGVVDARHDQ